VGFEPTKGFKTLTSLAVRRFRPLSQLSKYFLTLTILARNHPFFKVAKILKWHIIVSMARVIFKIKRDKQEPKNVTVSFDADKFERVAASFGLFRQEFLDSLERSESDLREGRFKKIKSLASLRK
jgi:hypothetical protein